ncbi:MAG: hypothetical protein NVSMB66_6560 [Candidatus Doudnabacteria bacterium]
MIRTKEGIFCLIGCYDVFRDWQIKGLEERGITPYQHKLNLELMAKYGRCRKEFAA